MSMIEVLLFLVGLIMLVKASDYLVRSAAIIAKLLGVSELLIGLTLVAVGTSIPELATAIFASFTSNNEIVSGNIVGACVLNIGTVLGISAIVRKIKTNEEMLKRDGYIMILAMLMFYAFAFNLKIGRLEGCVLLLFYFAYVMFLFGSKKKTDKKYHFKEFIIYFFKLGYLKTLRQSMQNPPSKCDVQKKKCRDRNRKLAREMGVLFISGVAVVIGARFFIDGALYFADYFHVSGTFIGITLVSLGTTIPELSVSVTAARRGYGNIAVGNVIGSNIANILLILGVASIIRPLDIINLTVWISLPFMLLMGAIVLIFIRTRWSIRRWEGAFLLTLYLGFMAFLFMNPH